MPRFPLFVDKPDSTVAGLQQASGAVHQEHCRPGLCAQSESEFSRFVNMIIWVLIDVCRMLMQLRNCCHSKACVQKHPWHVCELQRHAKHGSLLGWRSYMCLTHCIICSSSFLLTRHCIRSAFSGITFPKLRLSWKLSSNRLECVDGHFRCAADPHHGQRQAGPQ